jgi:hypothetical protein
MRTRRLAALLVLPLLLVGACASLDDDDDDDRDRDRDRAQAEERARSHCVEEADAQGLRVESVVRIEKVAKKRYEVKLRVGPTKKQLKKKTAEGERVLCRYDDEAREARID